MSSLRIAGAQIDLTVGDLAGNAAKIIDAVRWATEQGADVVLLPELAVTGYPPEDLVLRRRFVELNLESLQEIAASTTTTAAVVGFVDWAEDGGRPDDSVERHVANAAAVVSGGRIHAVYHKVLLPNYGVFDEDRYFVPGTGPGPLVRIGGVCAGVSICEDIWSPVGPHVAQAEAGAAVLLNINGSPYHRGKGTERARLLIDAARATRRHVVYVNTVGGQDELVFDGDSMVFDAEGGLVYRAAQFDEERFVVDLAVAAIEPAVPVVEVGGSLPETRPVLPVLSTRPRLDDDAEIYAALVTGLRDYVTKNGFQEVVVGLSGGIDSALTATIAVDALGPDAVWGITMPTRFSSQGSVDDSADLAGRLGCRFDVVPIDDIFAAYLSSLEPLFTGRAPGVAEENIQARIRGNVLMALSNKFGGMVVATGNKSELAVGYATLYGDMAGGYAVLKDVLKTTVYRLAEWRNREDEVIPRSIIDKAPSAELRPDQKDSDSLPEYPVLDEVLRRYVELDQSVEDIVAAGLDEELVRSIARMVDRNEYKRRQAAPGVKITRKAFGKDRRLPITNGYRA